MSAALPLHGTGAKTAADLQVLSGLGQAERVESPVSGHGPIQPFWPLGVREPECICSSIIAPVTGRQAPLRLRDTELLQCIPLHMCIHHPTPL